MSEWRINLEKKLCCSDCDMQQDVLDIIEKEIVKFAQEVCCGDKLTVINALDNRGILGKYMS